MPSLEDRQIRSVLDSVADRHPDGTIPRYYYAEGFLFAVACVPALIPPSAWLDRLGITRNLADCSEKEIESYIGALMVLYNRVNDGVMDEDLEAVMTAPFADRPLDNIADGCPVQQWCAGMWNGAAAFLVEEALIRKHRPGPKSEAEQEVTRTFHLVLGAISYFASEKQREKFHEGLPPDTMGRLAGAYADGFPGLLETCVTFRSLPPLPPEAFEASPFTRRRAKEKRSRKGGRT